VAGGFTCASASTSCIAALIRTSLAWSRSFDPIFGFRRRLSTAMKIFLDIWNYRFILARLARGASPC
jgi:hypothetical protein